MRRFLPISQFGMGLSLLFTAFFFSLFFTHKHHGFLKGALKSVNPTHFSFPQGFSKTFTLEVPDLLLFFIVGILFSKFRVQIRAFFWEGPSRLLTLFLGTCILSLLVSKNSAHLFQYVWLLKFSLGILLFNALRVSFTPFSSYKLYRLFAVIVCIVSLIVSILCIAQYFIQGPIGLKWLGESWNAFAGFSNPSHQRWIFDALFSTSMDSALLMRSSGLFYHPNACGAFLFFSLLFSFYFYLHSSIPKNQFFNVFEYKEKLISLFIFLQMFALATTFSRSAFLALFLSTALLFFFERKNARKQSLFWICATSTLACFFLFYDQFFIRGGIVNYNAIVQGADAERVNYLKTAFSMFKDHWLLGVGFNNFQFYLKDYLPADQMDVIYFKVHNIYLLLLAETGICGFSCALLFFYTVVKKLFLAPRTPENLVLISLIMGCILLGGCDMYLLENPKLRFVFFSLFALASAVSFETAPSKMHLQFKPFSK